MSIQLRSAIMILFLAALVSFCGGSKSEKVDSKPNSLGNGCFEETRRTPTANSINAVAALDDNTWLIGSEGGEIFKTEDLGQTWRLVHNAPVNRIAHMHFVDGAFGLAATFNSILVTEDGGETWADRSSDLKIWNLYGINHNTWIIRNEDGLLRTTDGGLSYAPFYSGKVWSGAFDRDQIGIIGVIENNKAVIKRTLDNGTSWTDSSDLGAFDSGTLKIVYLPGNNTGYDWIAIFKKAFVGTMSILGSKDSGASWEGLHADNVFDPAVVAAFGKAVFVCGELGCKISKTSDSWVDWKLPSDDPNAIDPKALFFADNIGLLGAAVGVIYKIEATTASFKATQIDQGSFYNINSIKMQDDNNGFYLDSNGAIYSTEDGGEAWEKMSQLSLDDLDELVDMISLGNSVQVVIAKNKAFRSADNGKTWTPVYTVGQYETLADIEFVSDEIGYMVVSTLSNDRILSTIDGGKSWTEPSNSSSNLNVLYKVAFAGETIGFAVGTKVLKTSDGQNWSESLAEVVADIRVVDEQTIYAVGDKLHLSQDAGASWSQVRRFDDTVLKPDLLLIPSPSILYVSGPDLIEGSIQSSRLRWSLDSGGTWQFENIQPKITSLAKTSSKIFASGPGGSLKVCKR